jgi:hypothetical protein
MCKGRRGGNTRICHPGISEIIKIKEATGY